MAQLLRRSKSGTTQSEVVLPKARLVPNLADLPMTEDELPAAFAERRAIDDEQVASILAEHGTSRRPIDELLIEAGVEERVVVQAFADMLTLPLADMRTMRPAPEAVAFVPEDLVREYDVLPLHIEGGAMWVAIAYPFQPGVVEALQSLPLTQVNVGIGARSEIRVAVNQAYRALASVEQNVTAFAQTAPALAPSVAELASSAAATGDDAPVVQVVNKIVTQALRDRASDVHLEPSEDSRARALPHRRRAQARWWSCPARWARRSSAASRSWPT